MAHVTAPLPPPRSIAAVGFGLRAPVTGDARLVADLMGSPDVSGRPTEIVRAWRAHWDEHGYGAWVVEDGEGARAGFVGLRAHTDVIRVTVRTREREGGEDLAARSLRAALAHAIEWLPDVPLRMRVAADDLTTRSVAESAGMVHVAELDHAVDGQEWQVLELPYLRIADRLPARAREALLDMWVAVNDAGGAVGFLPGASREDVSAVLDGYEARLERGDTVCVALNSPLGGLLGFGFVVGSTGVLMGHGATLERVMTDPARRGTHHGALLMAGLHRAARERGVELVTLDYRGGTGLGAFYARHGYAEVGRVPGAIRVAPGDDRDCVIMARAL